MLRRLSVVEAGLGRWWVGCSHIAMAFDTAVSFAAETGDGGRRRGRKGGGRVSGICHSKREEARERTKE